MLSFIYRGLLDVFNILAWVVVAFFKLLIWLIKSIVWLSRQFALGLLAIARPSMRFLAFVLFIIATIALVADMTPYLDHDQPMTSTVVSDHWQTISPLSLAATKSQVTSSVGAWAWATIEFLILNFPTYIVFGALGLLAAYLGKRRNTIDVYVN